MTFPKRRRVALGLSMMIGLLITVLTLGPPSPPSGFPGRDKLYHFVAFAVLVLPVALLWRPDLGRACLAAAAYGAMIEVVQPFFGRSGEWADLAANLAGVLAAAALGIVLAKLQGLRRRRSATVNRV